MTRACEAALSSAICGCWGCGREFKGDQGGYDPENDTTGQNEEAVPLGRLKIGRPEWTRTIDLFRVKEAL